MVEEGGLDEELGEGSSLNVVVVGLRDPSDPRVGRAVRGDVEVKGLKKKGEGGGEVNSEFERRRGTNGQNELEA